MENPEDKIRFLPPPWLRQGGISSHSNVEVGETFLKILPYLSQPTLMEKNYPLDHVFHRPPTDPSEVY